MVYVLGVYWCICLVSGVGSKTLCHACMWRIGVQVLSALNPVDPLHNCMFENKLCLQNVFLLKLFCNVPEGSGSWTYNMYFPVDEVTRKISITFSLVNPKYPVHLLQKILCFATMYSTVK